MVKYVRKPKTREPLYVIIMNKTHFGNYHVELFPCSHTGSPTTDHPTKQDMFVSWFAARRYAKSLYREYSSWMKRKYST